MSRSWRKPWITAFSVGMHLLAHLAAALILIFVISLAQLAIRRVGDPRPRRAKMAKPILDPRQYAGKFGRALVVHALITIAIGIFAAVVMAFLARPMLGLMLIGAFILGVMTRVWAFRSSASLLDVLQEARAAAHTLL